MTATDQKRKYDPAALAWRVRKFATLAHRAMKDPAVRDRQAGELSRHLAFLGDQLEDRPHSEIAIWLENVKEALGPM
jgi:hypothetical protein